MKRNCLIIAVIAIILVLTAKPVSADRNGNLVKRYCRNHYPTYQMRIVSSDSPPLRVRKGKRVIYVERVVSRSKGNRYGLIQGKWIIAYNKRVPKGKRVVSYLIYAPYSNEPDEILAIVDNGKLR